MERPSKSHRTVWFFLLDTEKFDINISDKIIDVLHGGLVKILFSVDSKEAKR